MSTPNQELITKIQLADPQLTPRQARRRALWLRKIATQAEQAVSEFHAHRESD